MYVATMQLQKAEEKKDEPAKAKALADIAFVYKYKGQPDSAILFYKKAKSIFLAGKDDESTGRTDIALAKIYIGQYKIDTALSYLIKANTLSKVLENQSMQADVQWNMGLIYKNKEEYAIAAGYFKIAMNTYYLQKNFSKYILAGCHLSMAYRLMDQNDSGLYILAQCISVFNKHSLSDSLLYATIQENYADTYLEMGKYPEALTHFTAALTQFIKYNSTIDIVYEKYSIGRTLAEMNRFKEAETYLLQSYRISDSLKNYKYLVWISNMLTQLYAKMGDWHNAYRYLQKKTVWSDTIGINDQIEKVNALNNKFEKEKKENEITLLKSRNQMTLWIFITALLTIILGSLFVWLYYTRRKIREEKILNYFATSLYNQNTIDDVFWDIAKNCISKLNFEDCVIYSFDSHQKVLVQKAAFGPKNPDGYIITNHLEIPLGKGIVGAVATSHKPEIIPNTTKDSRYIVDDEQRFSEITVPILLEGKLLGIIDSEHHKKNFFKKRHLKLLQKIADTCTKKITRHFVEDSLRKQIASDLHDDIGSTLSSINILSNIAMQKKMPEEYLNRQMASINEHSKRMMESMDDMVWAINPLNDNMESLAVKMKEWASEFCEISGIQLSFTIIENIVSQPLDVEKRKNLFLIFKEAVNNAIKYSGCSHLQVSFSKEGNVLAMEVQDDGKGFDTAIKQWGNGLRNMRERSLAVNGNIAIESAPGKGTSIQLFFMT